MARPKTLEATILEIRSGRADGKTLDQIGAWMEQNREVGLVTRPMPGRNTIAKYTREYDALPSETKHLDRAFEWHRMEKYELPWEASRIILDLLDLVEQRHTELLEWLTNTAPGFTEQATARMFWREWIDNRPATLRQIRWVWRVHQAAPEIGNEVGSLKDLWSLAMRFSDREVHADLLRSPVSFADLDMLLVYRPWLGWPDNDSRHRRYHAAVDNGLIPPLQAWNYDRKTLVETLLPQSSDPNQELDRMDRILGGGYLHTDHAELLESQHFPSGERVNSTT